VYDLEESKDGQKFITRNQSFINKTTIFTKIYFTFSQNIAFEMAKHKILYLLIAFIPSIATHQTGDMTFLG